MRIGDQLYFAPGIRFSDLDWTGEKLPVQYKERIHGFYLEPARMLAKDKHAFAAGVILVCCIDALAKLRYNSGVGDRFKKWVQKELPSFQDSQISNRFYEDFRNGLVHESRIKCGGSFSLEQPLTVEQPSGVLSINPMELSKEMDAAFRKYHSTLERNGSARRKLIDALQRDFEFELNN